jgi:glycosyltransferase involved in cell wall biosynthesis
MGSANYWGGPVTTGSQHYARHFAEEGWDVAYLSDQISPLHPLRWKSRVYTRDKLRLWARGGMRDLGGRLFAYNHFTLLPIFDAPLLRSELAARHSLDLTVPPLQRVLEREGFDAADLLWIDHLVFEGLLDRVPHRRSVYRLADDPRLFPEPYPPSMLRRYPALVERVDLLVATSQRLAEQVAATRSGPVLWLPNGVDYPRFAAAAPPPPEYSGIPAPRVVYVGSLEPWFDDGLLAEVARRRPRVSFVVVGPVRIPMPGLRALPNVHVLGPRAYAAVPGYMAHAQVGIVPFRRLPEVDAVNPIKVYEYLAAGLPVVATAWDELERMRTPAALAEGPAAFGAALDAALADPGDAAARREYARENSWAARFRRLLAALEATPEHTP